MYALWTIFTLGPGMREAADKLCEGWGPVLSSLDGFKGATFVGDESSGEYAALTLWETREHAEAARANTQAGVDEKVAPMAKGPVVRKIYEVWSVTGAE